MNPARGFALLDVQRWSGTAAALCAFLSCAVSGELGVPFVLAVPAAVVAGELWPQRESRRADLVWTTLLAACLLALAAQVVVGSTDVVLAAARFAVLLCAHRLWQRRTARDEYVLLLLSLLLVCAGSALSAEFLFGLAFLGYALSATWAVALTHLRFAIVAAKGPEGSLALLRSRRIATPGLLARLAGLSLVGMAGAALVFVAFPRVTIAGLRRPVRAKAVAGLADRVDLSGHGVIGDDPRVVLRVRLDPEPPSHGGRLDVHWRARALEVWTGHGWRARDGAPPVPVFGQLPPLPLQDRARRPAAVNADIEAVAGFTDGIVLTPDGWPRQVSFRRPMAARGVRQRLLRNEVGDLFYTPVDVGDLRYTVAVDHAQGGLERLRGRGNVHPASVQPSLEVPSALDPRVGELARTLTEGKDPFDAALSIERYLSSTLRYTRELAGETNDPIAHFLFERKEGHCELFSSAMVLLLRSAGIPARNVTGYYGGERTDAGYYAVRGGDAHSWVEVFIPGSGFVAFDPTPASGRGASEGGLWARAVLLWDVLQQRWRALVVDYDLVAQARLAERAASLVREVGQRLSGKGGNGSYVRAAANLLVVLGALALVATLARRLRGRRRDGAVLGEGERQARLLWRRARKRLHKSGLEVGVSTTPREVLGRLEESDPRAASALRPIVDAHSSARWGGRPLPRAVARRLLRQFDLICRGA